MWLLLCIAAAAGASISIFIDNYVTDVYFKGRLPQAQKIFGVVAYAMMAVATICLFPIEEMPLYLVLLLMGSGAISSLSYIPYYKALKYENTTGAAIFFQLAPVIYLIAGWGLLGEVIGGRELLAFCLILLAPLVVIFSSSKRSRKLELKAAGLFLFYVFVAVGANLLFVYGEEQGEVGFATVFFWIVFGKLLTDLVTAVVMKSWRKRFFWVFKKSRGKLLVPMLANEVVYGAVEVFGRLALIAAPVAIASVVMNAGELVLTFVFGIVLTVLWPKFGREKLQRRSVVAHLIAVVLATVGIVLLG
jgi:drug/metabolite transporter (DMT)-like permease